MTFSEYCDQDFILRELGGRLDTVEPTTPEGAEISDVIVRQIADRLDIIVAAWRKDHE